MFGRRRLSSLTTLPPNCLMDVRGPLGWVIRHGPWWNKLKDADAGPRDYGTLGFRVPTVIVSPYADRTATTSKTFDHTSILALIGFRWGLPPLTRRDAAAHAPLEFLNFDAPAQPGTMDGLETPKAGKGAWRR
jgi:phospholipase C